MTEEPTGKRRVVAIVGRPNVGKSAIFNRLIGRRAAIVHEESGVTRDRIMQEASWNDRRFELIDTGGVCDVRESRTAGIIEQGIRQQVEAALADASVACLVVDVQAGLNPMDQEVATLLHRRGCPTFVVANKADHAGMDGQVVDFSGLGFPVFPVSALHNRGFGELMDAVLTSLPEGENPSVLNPLRVAVVGRPNVGKSSYVNRLLRSDRVIVSEVPGTTRDSIDIPFVVGKGPQARHYILTDTAGLRPASKVDNAVEVFSQFRADKSIRRANVVLMVLDAEQGPTAQDKKIAAKVLEHERGCVVVVNKWDVAEKGGVTEREYMPALQEAVPFLRYCPVCFISAKTGYNIRRTVEALDHVAAQVNAELPTGILNRTIHDAWERVQPPAIKGKRLKLYYAAQVGRDPVRIRIFVNDPERVTPSYSEYLVRSLRERFGLEGAPVRIQFRRRTREPGRDAGG